MQERGSGFAGQSDDGQQYGGHFDDGYDSGSYYRGRRHRPEQFDDRSQFQGQSPFQAREQFDDRVQPGGRGYGSGNSYQAPPSGYREPPGRPGPFDDGGYDPAQYYQEQPGRPEDGNRFGSPGQSGSGHQFGDRYDQGNYYQDAPGQAERFGGQVAADPGEEPEEPDDPTAYFPLPDFSDDEGDPQADDPDSEGYGRHRGGGYRQGRPASLQTRLAWVVTGLVFLALFGYVLTHISSLISGTGMSPP